MNKEPTDKWTVTAPDGTKFYGNTPLRAASEASKYRLQIDPVAQAKFLAVIETIRQEGEDEHRECMEKYGTLDCPHCGGSGHIADVHPAVTAKSDVKGGWIPVSERLPEPFTEVLVTYRNERGAAKTNTAEYDPEFEETNGWCLGSYFAATVTHWMPMPEAADDTGRLS